MFWQGGDILLPQYKSDYGKMEHEKIYTKISKLLDLEKGARKLGSLEEAQAAAGAVQRLLLRYDLHLADVAAGKEQEFQFVLGKYFPQDDGTGARWRMSFMACRAKHNRCRCMARGNGTLTALGTEEDVTAVCNLFSYLSGAFVRFAENEMHKASFLNGCVMGLNIRLTREAAEEDARREQAVEKKNRTKSTGNRRPTGNIKESCQALTIPQMSARCDAALDDYIKARFEYAFCGSSLR